MTKSMLLKKKKSTLFSDGAYTIAHLLYQTKIKLSWQLTITNYFRLSERKESFKMTTLLPNKLKDCA